MKNIFNKLIHTASGFHDEEWGNEDKYRFLCSLNDLGPKAPGWVNAIRYYPTMRKPRRVEGDDGRVYITCIREKNISYASLCIYNNGSATLSEYFHDRSRDYCKTTEYVVDANSIVE